MDLNLAEATREQARFLPPYRIVEQGDVIYSAAGTRIPGPFNSVMGTGAECPDAQATLDDAQAFFGEMNRGFTVFVRTHVDGALARACDERGFSKMSDSPGMVLGSRIATVHPPRSVEIREVKNAADAAGFVDVVADAYTSIGMRTETTRRVFSMPERWISPHFIPFTLLDHEEPAAAAMLHLSHGIAGVYWVGTKAAARGRGHASLLVRHVSNLGFERGAPAVVLQATPFGEPVYRKLGYEEVTRYPWYLATRA